MAKKKKSFEDALFRAEEIASLLEKGEMSLDESLSLYKEGILAINDMSDRLNEAQTEISILRKSSDEIWSKEKYNEPEYEGKEKFEE